MAGSHFDHSHFVVVRQAEQGERYADMVVQVAFGVEKAVFYRQDGSQQFLGRCLSVCSGDTDNRTADHSTVAVRQLPQGRQHVVHKDCAFSYKIIRIVD